ncbi:replication protein A 14 kDa subunit-like [Corticium candelabrum]|uniref:replication protein A 14 kDa subunit-like n=1 Tax=Corticium candelabrum TaxID=121492 RepID=UPI002E258910|nr:replication protein A 14 kDa subunit-like [Corticium candelabrum]
MDGLRGPIPRINGSMIQMNGGNVCCLVGKIQKASPNRELLTVVTSDNQIVNVSCGYGTFEVSQGYVELIVLVNADARLTAHSTTSYGEDFDLAYYNEAVVIAQQHSSLFGL